MPAVPPVITSVNCTAGMPLPAFTLTWDIQEGYTGPFSIEVLDMFNAVVPGDAVPGVNGGTWTANGSSNMQANQLYTVRVGVPASPGIYSSSANLLFNPATNIATEYDGTSITINWTPPVGLPPGSMLVLFTAGSYLQATVVQGSTGAVFVPDPAQTPDGGAWSLTLTPQIGVSNGPESADATVFNSRPAVSGLDVNATQAAILAYARTPAAGFTGTPSFIGTLWADDEIYYQTAPVVSTLQGQELVVVVQLPASINSAYAYSLTLAQAATGATRVSRGPDGLPLPLLAVAPAIVRVSTAVGATATDRLVTGAIAPPPGPTRSTGSFLVVEDGAGAQIGNPVSGDGFTGSVPVSVTVGAAYALFARAMIGTSSTPMTATGVSILTTVPTLASAAYDGAALTLAWNAVTDPGTTGYQVQLLAQGQPVATSTSGTTSATLALPAGAFQAQVRAAAGADSLGPPSAALTLITAAPAGPAAAWGATDTDGTLSWTAVPGAGGYALEIWSGAQRVYSASVTGGATVTATLPAGTLSAGGLYSFRVQATAGGSGAPTVTGPFSASAPVIAAAPGQVTTSYDGATVAVGWAPVAGAAGYVVTLLDGTTPVGNPVEVTATRASVAAAYDPTKAYTVVVQATDGDTVGPASAAAAVFSAGLFLSTDTDVAANVYPANAVAMSAFDIVLQLPQIFATAPAAGDLPTTSPFVMGEGTAPYSYTLTIPAASIAWTFSADPVRADLRTAYLAFLATLENLTATPVGLVTVQQAIGRAMPQTFAETLYYNYGLRSDQGYVDLKPGLLLRVEYESYQYLGAAVNDGQYLNGYTASSSSEYLVAAYVANGTWLTGFDRFLATIAAAGGVVVPTPSTSQRKMQGGGGLIDTVYQQFRRPFVRLIYPPTFLAQNTTGTPYPEYNALLIAGSTLSAMQTATDNIRNGNAPGADVAELYFRGRATLSAGMLVWLDGEQRSVPLGTSVGNLLDMRAARPPVMPLAMTGIALARAPGTAVIGDPDSYDVGGGWPVRLDWAPGALASWLDLPMLHGDRLWTGPRESP